MSIFEIEIKKTIEFNKEDVTDLLSAIFEGGVGYWCVLDNTTETWKKKKKELGPDVCFEDIIYEILADGGKVRLFDAEDDDEVWFLTMHKLINGIKMAIDYNDWPQDNEGNYDLCDVDGCVGDLILQYALFAEQVYG